jgi:hypothetical protein
MTNDESKNKNEKHLEDLFLAPFIVIGGICLLNIIHLKKPSNPIANKFRNSIESTVLSQMSKIKFQYYPRNIQFNGRHCEENKFRIFDHFKYVILKGARRSGSSIFISNQISQLYPIWSFQKPYGFYLSGLSYFRKEQIDDWLKGEISSPWGSYGAWEFLNTLLKERRDQQWFRYFLLRTFKNHLPKIFQPQPAIIIVDDAEILLKFYGISCLRSFDELIKEAERSGDIIRLVFMVNSDNAARSLQLINEGRIAIMDVPKVIKQDFVSKEHFEDYYDSSIGLAWDSRDQFGEHQLSHPIDEDLLRDYVSKKKEFFHSQEFSTTITYEDFKNAQFPK